MFSFSQSAVADYVDYTLLPSNTSDSQSGSGPVQVQATPIPNGTASAEIGSDDGNVSVYVAVVANATLTSGGEAQANAIFSDQVGIFQAVAAPGTVTGSTFNPFNILNATVVWTVPFSLTVFNEGFNLIDESTQFVANFSINGASGFWGTTNGAEVSSQVVDDIQQVSFPEGSQRSGTLSFSYSGLSSISAMSLGLNVYAQASSGSTPANNNGVEFSDTWLFTVYDQNGNVVPNLVFQSANGWNYDVTDGYAASTPIAEPATLPLFGAGLGALALLGWRRKRGALAA